MPAKNVRSGHGGKAARRASKRLKRDTDLNGWVCTWCGGDIDTSLPSKHPMSFTADHPDALANGGALLGQALEPMHRRCNSAKNKSIVIDEDEWSAT